MKDEASKAASFYWLIRPKIRGKLNRFRADEARAFKAVGFGFVAVFFWSFIFLVIWRMLLYFRNTQGIGNILAGKLLALVLLTFLGILLLSNVITSLSTFFLSRDLELLVASPVDRLRIYGARLMETVLNSSWMVLLLAVPLFLAYGFTFRADPGFYLLAAGVMVPFLVLPGVAGVAFTLVLVNVFPARRTRDLLALIGLFTAAGVVVLFRFLRPERLVRPEEFRDLVDFISVLRTPSSVWLPNEWATDVLLGYLNGSLDLFPFLLLLSTAGAFLVGGGWLHLRFHPAGFSRAQEGANKKEDRTRSTWPERLFSGLGIRTGQLVAKEIRVFSRDSTQWSQLVLLGVLVAVYVYNIKVLPLYTGERVSFLLINVVSFLNLGLAGFVVAAIAARFVFPGISLEGRMMWLLRSSPLDVRTLFWSKYWVGTAPILLLALPLIVVTNLILEVSPFVFLLTTASMMGITLALTALALGFGTLFPNFESDNVAEIPTSFGGLLYMMAAVTYLAGVILFEAWPVYSFLLADLRGETLRNSGLPSLVLGFTSAATLTVLATVLPLRAGVRRVRALDF